jgi:lysophospholipase L1-like esterase
MRFVILISIVLSQLACKAQKIEIIEETNIFPLSVLSNFNIVCDGNSLTFQAYDLSGETYPNYLQIYLGSDSNTVKNKGVAGQTTLQMIEDAAIDIDKNLIPGKKNILIAWECGNDIYLNGNVQDAYSNFVHYCLARKKAGWRVVVLTLTPRMHKTPFGDTAVQFEAKRNEINALLLKNYNVFSDNLIDLNTNPRLMSINFDYFVSDEIHLTKKGVNEVAKMIYQLIRKN